jgi:light-regulated signal transduction histidine kinase (bacteriophytochrome)
VPKQQTDKNERGGNFVFAHNLINQLAVIVGHCDLLREELEDTHSTEHVDSIKKTAIQMADGLKEYQRTLEQMKKAG